MSEVHPNLKRLSSSSVGLFFSCPRKFQLTRTLAAGASAELDVHTQFGLAVGAGAQSVISDLPYSKLYQQYLAWPGDLEDPYSIKDKKTFYDTLIASDRFSSFWREGFLSTYKLYKNAIELGYTIQFPNNFEYRGYIDAVVEERKNPGVLVPVELKTTKSTTITESMYANSSQAVGYSAVVDYLSNSSTVVSTAMYFIYSSMKREWTYMPVPVTKAAQVDHLIGIMQIIHQIEEYSRQDHFPKNGNACYSFGRECRFFGICGMSNKGLRLESMPVIPESEDKFEIKIPAEKILSYHDTGDR